MQGYIIKRVLIAALTIFAVLSVVFFVFRLGPADPVALMLPPEATPQDAQALTEKFGLDKPLAVQYVNFLKNAVHGDFGISFRFNESAAQVMFQTVPATLKLGLMALAFSILVGLSVGIISAVKPDSIIDRVGRVFALAGMSLPAFWVGVMLILFFGVTLRWLPIAGKGTYLHYIMPAFCLSLYPIALITRLSRSSMLDALKSDYVVMARIKGVPEFHVIMVHALKNASIPILTVIFSIMGTLLVGRAVVVEFIFSWPGIGKLAMESFFARDYPVVQVFVVFVTFVVVTLNLIVDILYAYIDHRIRYQ
ncbi:binding-protein-dependent transport systems inner membrane component [Desulfatibacillum aliphaticivorans]|uniref:Binding-protein-dependent transport systems inner membrane component n=1 Tax=Desulfatibacillum aliphaticivorans TaxID=218208 RepID=B8F8T9_DESAL|nr:ABC transporter permease [Desulfatibacillum aliphaticivorans]ACL01971.1 binding-protein-dependent transport systems inner membrane component [Desulfatibacillum aliphaticivorans]